MTKAFQARLAASFNTEGKPKQIVKTTGLDLVYSAGKTNKQSKPELLPIVAKGQTTDPTQISDSLHLQTFSYKSRDTIKNRLIYLTLHLNSKTFHLPKEKQPASPSHICTRTAKAPSSFLPKLPTISFFISFFLSFRILDLPPSPAEQYRNDTNHHHQQFQEHLQPRPIARQAQHLWGGSSALPCLPHPGILIASTWASCRLIPALPAQEHHPHVLKHTDRLRKLA